MKKVLLLLFFVGIFAIPNNVLAFRCDTDLVTTGDSKIKTIQTCGKPTYKEYKCLERNSETGKCINNGESWYYNCGANDFYYELIFSEGGKLVEERTVGRGNGSSDCRGK